MVYVTNVTQFLFKSFWYNIEIEYTYMHWYDFNTYMLRGIITLKGISGNAVNCLDVTTLHNYWKNMSLPFKCLFCFFHHHSLNGLTFDHGSL